jgi:Rod binding domain-containing protein
MNIGSAQNSLGRAGLSSIESLAVRQAGDLNNARMDGLRGLQRDDINSAGRKFEQLFAGLMTKELRKGLEGFFGEGPGADTFTA